LIGRNERRVMWTGKIWWGARMIELVKSMMRTKHANVGRIEVEVEVVGDYSGMAVYWKG